MSTSYFFKWSGPAAMAGGLAWAAGGSLMALRPAGVPGGAYRDSDNLWPFLIYVGAVLIVVGLVGLYHRQARRFDGLGKVPIAISIVGSLVLVGGMTLEGATGAEQFWLVFMAGYLALFVGLLLAGIRLSLGKVSTRWTGALLIAASVALIMFNTEDWRAWLAVPFGVAWVLLGYTLWSDKSTKAAQPEATAYQSSRWANMSLLKRVLLVILAVVVFVIFAGMMLGLT